MMKCFMQTKLSILGYNGNKNFISKTGKSSSGFEAPDQRVILLFYSSVARNGLLQALQIALQIAKSSCFDKSKQGKPTSMNFKMDVHSTQVEMCSWYKFLWRHTAIRF